MTRAYLNLKRPPGYTNPNNLTDTTHRTRTPQRSLRAVALRGETHPYGYTLSRLRLLIRVWRLFSIFGYKRDVFCLVNFVRLPYPHIHILSYIVSYFIYTDINRLNANQEIFSRSIEHCVTPVCFSPFITTAGQWWAPASADELLPCKN